MADPAPRGAAAADAPPRRSHALTAVAHAAGARSGRGRGTESTSSSSSASNDDGSGGGRGKRRRVSRSRSRSRSPPPAASPSSSGRPRAAVAHARTASSSSGSGNGDARSAVFLTAPVGRRTYRPPKSVVKGVCRSVHEFEKLGRVGEGTYGIVYRARDTASEEVVAIKRVKMENETGGMPVSSVREIALLRRARGHPNIVRLLDVAVGRDLNAVFLALEFCEHDMAALIDHLPVPLLEGQCKGLTLQLLEGVEWLHALSIVHRDIKMSNILLNARGVLKLADFGMARLVGTQVDGRSARGGHLSPRVVTLWYRAPEILFGDPGYGVAVDLWAVGCVLGELLLHEPLLPGKTEQQQVELLAAMFGEPHEGIWPGFDRLPLAGAYRVPGQPYDNLAERFPHRGEGCLSLLRGLLLYDPRRRLSPSEARLHPYFQCTPLPVGAEDMPSYPEQLRAR